MEQSNIAVELFQFEMNFLMNNQSIGPVISNNSPDMLGPQSSSYFNNPIKADNIFECNDFTDSQPQLNTNHFFVEKFLQKLEDELNLFLISLIKKNLDPNSAKSAMCQSNPWRSHSDTDLFNDDVNQEKCYTQEKEEIDDKEDKLNTFIKFETRKNSDSLSQLSYLDQKSISEVKTKLNLNRNDSKSK